MNRVSMIVVQDGDPIVSECFLPLCRLSALTFNENPRKNAVIHTSQQRKKYDNMQRSKCHNQEITWNHDNIRITTQIPSPRPVQTCPCSQVVADSAAVS